MILLAALLCNYGRGFCLIDVGTEGRYEKVTGYIYQARSRAFDPLHPCFEVLFSIEDENRVLLLWIEEVGSINEIAP